MQRQILGFLALIAAITTSILLLRSGLQTPLVASLLTATLIVLQIRMQEKSKVPVNETHVPLQVIEDLNHRLSETHEQLVSAKAETLKLEDQLKKVSTAETEDAAVLMFLRVLQEKSRILDFALTDIARLPDPQVGAAARVVHQGLRSVLADSFAIDPIATESEGQTLQLPEDFDSTRYRVLHSSAAQPNNRGVVLHRGWEVKHMNLPRSLRQPGEALPSVLAPVEIEAREALS